MVLRGGIKMIKYCRYYDEENKTENIVSYSTLDGMDKEVEEKHTFNGNKVIKFANTIEELVDKYLRVFVGKDKEMTPYIMLNKDDKYFSKNETVVYACIWIQLPNGAYRLEPVAKLNEKGELELL